MVKIMGFYALVFMNNLDSLKSTPPPTQRPGPLIGVTCQEELISDSPKDSPKNTLNLDYITALERAGGSPVILPTTHRAKTTLKHLDGLMLTGGADVDPFYFGEEPIPAQGKIEPGRDEMELSITQRALEMDLPILGICRGMQVLNIAAGGDIYQDIYSQPLEKEKILEIVGQLDPVSDPIKHLQKAPGKHPTHGVKVRESSQLYRMIGEKNIRVNSFHHQAVRTVAPGFVVSACSRDGVIEGMERVEGNLTFAVQWHPEQMEPVRELERKIFKGFVRACGGQRIDQHDQ